MLSYHYWIGICWMSWRSEKIFAIKKRNIWKLKLIRPGKGEKFTLLFLVQIRLVFWRFFSLRVIGDATGPDLGGHSSFFEIFSLFFSSINQICARSLTVNKRKVAFCLKKFCKILHIFFLRETNAKFAEKNVEANAKQSYFRSVFEAKLFSISYFRLFDKY